MSQGTRDLFHQIRDFLAGAAKELAEREAQELEYQVAYHNAEHEDVTASRKASSTRGSSDASFDVSADLTFDNGSAELVLDGSHRYTLDVVTGQVTKRN